MSNTALILLDLYNLTQDKSFLFLFWLGSPEWYLLCVKSQHNMKGGKHLSIIPNSVSCQSRKGEKANLVSRLTESSLYRDILREPLSILIRWEVSSKESFIKYVKISRVHPLSTDLQQYSSRFIAWKAREQNLDLAKSPVPFSNVCKSNASGSVRLMLFVMKTNRLTLVGVQRSAVQQLGFHTSVLHCD